MAGNIVSQVTKTFIDWRVPRDVLANVVDSPDDDNVAISNCAQRDDPGGHEERQNKYPRAIIVGQVIVTAAGQVTFRNVFAVAKQRQTGEDGRINPNADDGNENSQVRRSPRHI